MDELRVMYTYMEFPSFIHIEVKSATTILSSHLPLTEKKIHAVIIVLNFTMELG